MTLSVKDALVPKLQSPQVVDACVERLVIAEVDLSFVVYY